MSSARPSARKAHNQSFAALLEGLSAWNEHQEAVIKQLREENSELQAHIGRGASHSNPSRPRARKSALFGNEQLQSEQQVTFATDPSEEAVLDRSSVESVERQAHTAQDSFQLTTVRIRKSALFSNEALQAESVGRELPEERRQLGEESGELQAHNAQDPRCGARFRRSALFGTAPLQPERVSFATRISEEDSDGSQIGAARSSTHSATEDDVGNTTGELRAAYRSSVNSMESADAWHTDRLSTLSSALGETANTQPEVPEGSLTSSTSSADKDQQGRQRVVRLDSFFDKRRSSLYSAEPGPLTIPEIWPDLVCRPGELKVVMKNRSRGRLGIVDHVAMQRSVINSSCCQKMGARIIMRPNSLHRLTWDFFSSLMVCYDVITIPLMAIALDKDDILGGGTGSFTDAMDMATTLFWAVDIPCSFLTGFHDEGSLEMRFQKIARKYIRTWFFFDFLIVLIDVVVFAVANPDQNRVVGFFRIGKTARMVRILRAVRLIRFVKLQRVLSEFLELIDSEFIRAIFNVSLAIGFIFLINHYLACGWFLVGHIGVTMGVQNWIQENKIFEHSAPYAYTTSLHWSLTQFTPASMEIRPYNLSERTYAIMCLMFALVTFSSFLGSITASITQLRTRTTEVGKTESLLRKYFSRNKVSQSLSKSIWTFLKEQHFKHATRSKKPQVQALMLLPVHLKLRLNEELYGPHITRAPFFYQYLSFCSDGHMELCSNIEERSHMCGELLFLEGRVAEKMLFNAGGFMKYDYHEVDHELIRVGPVARNHILSFGTWISEHVLWVKWIHTGTLTAETTCEIFELDSHVFRTVTALFQHSLPFVKVYASLFREMLEDIGPENVNDLITDVSGLEDLTKQAWLQVSRRAMHDFRMMPTTEFPRCPRKRRRSSYGQWQAEKNQKNRWRRLLRFLCCRRSQS